MGARRNEPPWLTAIYTVTGFLLLAAAGYFAYLVITYWPLFLLLAVGGFAYYWYTASPAAQERQAGNKTAALLRELAALEYDFPTAEQFSNEVVQAICPCDPSTIRADSVLAAFRQIAQELYAAEGFTLAAISEPPPRLDTIEGARYREHLLQHHAKLANTSAYDAVRATVIDCFTEFYNALPPVARRVAAEADAGDAPAALSVPVIDTIPDVPRRVEGLILAFYSEKARSRGLFADLRNQLDQNHYTASGLSQSGDGAKLKMPTELDGSPADIAYRYLAHTPLWELFKASVPFDFPLQARFEHTHILAGSGHGKTQTLQHLIVSDLRADDPPGLVIIDSQGDMLSKISKLALFEPQKGSLADRLLIIDPSDVEYPPALNIFDVNLDRLRGYGPAAREQILNGVIELYDYLFGSLLGAELTQKQSVIFRYLARLLLAIPGATIHTLQQLLTDHTPFMSHIEKLPPGARMFFETEFPHKSFVDTKRQIQRRLWGILENPTFERMLSGEKNRIDMFDALNSGKIVLVNTAKDFLKAERSSFLGRFFIALTLQAALERAALPEERRRPAFLYIDEAADYFDDNIDDLLTQARKYRLGVVFSHQYLGQLAPALHSSIAANTSIKLAGGISDRDARSIAPDMRTTPTFILDQHKREGAAQFAGYVRNHTPRALSLSIPFGTLEREPAMDKNALAKLREDNRARVSMPSNGSEPLSELDIAGDPKQLAQPAGSQDAARSADADWSG